METKHLTKPNHSKASALLRVSLIAAIALAPLAAAQAYVGPGAGLSLLSALWGVLAAIGAAVLFVITWPLRRMRRRKREAKKAQDASTVNRTSAGPATPSDSTEDPTSRS